MAYRNCLWLLVLLAPALSATAAEVCDIPPRYGLSSVAVAVVRAACDEHRLWFRPFIDRDGRIASLSVTEAESENLADNGLIAWQRVAGYWRESSTLAAMGAIPGAQSCFAAPGARYTDSDCRSFLVDNPWSAAFISWVMTRAGTPGFVRSPRHIDYIRAAYQSNTSRDGPYRLTDPMTEKPAPGDLLCFLRDRSNSLSYSDLLTALATGGAGNWKSHCEVVVAANVGGDRTLYLVGGNVANTVAMRMLTLDRPGRIQPPLAGAPLDATLEQRCSPGQEDECNLNRQDWVALLKLRVTTPAPAPTPAPTTSPTNPQSGRLPAVATPVRPPDIPARR
ncbi:DUF2272 domain-containing protein [Stenotrophomonas sp. YIM B06876]|uniref:DUF2272 domain-containing protein n=1 Tax=Stenotrophomonas sp. YIM B06876 TaxID=3060211 RepID=UPI0027386637|nr:DUF2272 domain-containing protein [Stenotrophomonas sp. YIM B06876]